MQAPGTCNPQNKCACNDVEYVWSDMYCGGGFAAHFQLAGSHWMRAAALTKYKTPVLIIGPIWQYSEGPECKHVGGDWTCFFEPMSPCQEELKKHGKQLPVDTNKLTTYDDTIIPEQFRHVGIAYWWGIVQERMFRMKPEVQDYIIKEAGGWFPGLNKESVNPVYYLQTEREHIPIAGMHVRHGDKHSDGFKHHSLEMELLAVQASPECRLSKVSGNSTLPTSDTIPSSSQEEGMSNDTKHKVCFASDGSPLAIYVASDDPTVLAKAAEMGHLVDTTGVSQATKSAGMLTTLLSKPEMGYNATLEIIRDITLLSRCSTLVGIAASQVFRMSVGISNARRNLQGGAWAMDHTQIRKVAQMSGKYHIPLVENFQVPPHA